jgi:hypothetical protein
MLDGKTALARCRQERAGLARAEPFLKPQPVQPAAAAAQRFQHGVTAKENVHERVAILAELPGAERIPQRRT